MTVVKRRRLPSGPRTVDREAREFEATVATEAPIDGVVLRLDGLTIPDDVPLLLDHEARAEATVGMMVSHRRQAGALVGRFRISADPGLAWLVERVADGTLSGVSVGFAVEAWGEARDGVRVAERARLVEVSVTPVPADQGAKVRTKMTQDDAPAETGTNTAAAPAAEATEAPEAPVVERAAINREIRAIAKTFGLGAGFADDLIDAGASADEARRAAQQALATRSAPLVARTTGMTHLDGPAEFVARAGEAVFARINPRHQLSEPARAYACCSNVDLAREALTRAGASPAGAAHDVITRALHTTSDFPALLGDAVNRQVRAAYQSAPNALRQVARQTTAPDFRAKTSVQLGEAPRLEPVNEAGEYTYGAIAEAKERYRLGTFGRIVAISRQAIVNDDLGAFTGIAELMGRAAAETEASVMVDLFTSNSGAGPTMDDGAALFDATHGNLASPGAGISVDTLATARAAMRKQTGLSGQPINVTPRFIVVPPDLETSAEQVTADLTPAAVDDANPFAGRLQVLAEARLTDAARWYVVADPAQISGLEFAYLEGEEGPQITTRAGFEVDGVEIKARLDFGAAFLDWRGWYANPGQ